MNFYFVIMVKIDFMKIEESIRLSGWFRFGEREFECPGLGEEVLRFYMNNNQLPSPCDKCYKTLIFWEGSYSKENVTNFFDMINFSGVDYRGKLNEEVVVFYFRDKKQMLEFLGYLENKMQEYNVKGKTQWRRACKKFQKLKPELWKNAKEFISDTQLKPR